MRVVSLLPSATEILCQIGGGHLLVGRSHECDHPGTILDRPVLTAQRISNTIAPGALAPDPAEIDRQVRAQLTSGQSLYTVDAQRLKDLRPDLILTQDLCQVCSIDLETVRRIAADMSPSPEIVSLNPHTVEDVLEDHLTIGHAVGMEDAAIAAVSALRERMYQAIEYVNAFTEGPSIAFLEWTDPLFVGGHWTPQLIERAGGTHPLNPPVASPESGTAEGMQQAYRKAGKSVRIPSEILVASKPDMLIVCPCGIDLNAAREMTRALAREPWWDRLPAARAGAVAIVDGNQYFNRPGPRLVDCFEFLVGLINKVPSMIPPGFAWERFE